MEVSGQLCTPAVLPSVEVTPDTHWMGGWVGHRAGLDAVAKREIPSHLPGTEPRSSSHYTD